MRVHFPKGLLGSIRFSIDIDETLARQYDPGKTFTIPPSTIEPALVQITNRLTSCIFGRLWEWKCRYPKGFLALCMGQELKSFVIPTKYAGCLRYTEGGKRESLDS